MLFSDWLSVSGTNTVLRDRICLGELGGRLSMCTEARAYNKRHGGIKVSLLYLVGCWLHEAAAPLVRIVAHRRTSNACKSTEIYAIEAFRTALTGKMLEQT